MSKFIKTVKDKAQFCMNRAYLYAVGISMSLATPVYASGDLGEMLQTNLTQTATMAINTLATIIGISGLFKGVMTIKDFVEGTEAGNPDAKNQGVKSLGVTFGLIMTAGVLLATKNTVISFITAAMTGI